MVFRRCRRRAMLFHDAYFSIFSPRGTAARRIDATLSCRRAADAAATFSLITLRRC